MMTQEEINKMMQGGNSSSDDAAPAEAEASEEGSYYLDTTEKDAIGEVSNICMGTCATTLYTLLNKRVHITTPKVTVGTIEDHISEFKTPYVGVEVSYTEGISGYNIFILKKKDVLMMTNLLMGGEGEVNEGDELDELAFSAISEVMNQMVGSSSTALADVLGRPINISTPRVKALDVGDTDFSELVNEKDVTIMVSFRMEIEGLLESNIMQIIPYESGKEILHKILGGEEEEAPAPAAPSESVQAAPPQAPEPTYSAQQPTTAPQPPIKEQSVVGVKAVQYQSFDSVPGTSGGAADDKNMGLIMEVPLQVTVELGSSRKTIKEILALSTGSVVVLNRMAGEMVDIMVNGVLFAVGEVVVIDDNYGVRITEIVNKAPV